MIIAWGNGMNCPAAHAWNNPTVRGVEQYAGVRCCCNANLV